MMSVMKMRNIVPILLSICLFSLFCSPDVAHAKNIAKRQSGWWGSNDETESAADSEQQQEEGTEAQPTTTTTATVGDDASDNSFSFDTQPKGEQGEKKHDTEDEDQDGNSGSEAGLFGQSGSNDMIHSEAEISQEADKTEAPIAELRADPQEIVTEVQTQPETEPVQTEPAAAPLVPVSEEQTEAADPLTEKVAEGTEVGASVDTEMASDAPVEKEVPETPVELVVAQEMTEKAVETDSPHDHEGHSMGNEAVVRTSDDHRDETMLGTESASATEPETLEGAVGKGVVASEEAHEVQSGSSSNIAAADETEAKEEGQEEKMKDEKNGGSSLQQVSSISVILLTALVAKFIT